MPEYLGTLKERGVPLWNIVIAMCTCILTGSNSMQRCADWLSDPNIRMEFGIDGNVSQRTINRALGTIGEHACGLISKAWKGLNERYDLDHDTNIDGSAVVFNGQANEMGMAGYPRDFKDQSRPQIEFMTAQLQRSGIPFLIRPFPGNTSDAAQYRSVLPSVFEMIRKGSWIVMDNGGAASDILDSIVDSGNRYLTRVKMNMSDDKRIAENKEKWEYADDGVCCLRHVFDSSGRTTYLFFSADGYMRSYNAAKRSVERMLKAIRSYEDGTFRKSDFVTVKRNVLANIEVKVAVQSRFGYDDPGETEYLVNEVMSSRAGIFKLESSEQLTPFDALNKYRARSSVEHLMHSLKRITGLKPLRVWKRSSTYGAMVLALLSEMAIAMAKYELEPKIVNKMKAGKRIAASARPSTESVVWSLGHLTVSRTVENGRVKGALYSNWNPVSNAIFDNIRNDPVRKGVLAGT
jgi:hypothetical protein